MTFIYWMSLGELDGDELPPSQFRREALDAFSEAPRLTDKVQ